MMCFKNLVSAGLMSLFVLSGGVIAGESGEKGGTADINIGVGELTEAEQSATATERAAERGNKEKKKHKKAAKQEKKKHKQKHKNKHKQKHKNKHKQKHKKRAESAAAEVKEGNAETTYKVEKGE